jgi:hypothetical protein
MMTTHRSYRRIEAQNELLWMILFDWKQPEKVGRCRSHKNNIRKTVSAAHSINEGYFITPLPSYHSPRHCAFQEVETWRAFK